MQWWGVGDIIVKRKQARELDSGAWLSVKPFNHVIMSAYIDSLSSSYFLVTNFLNGILLKLSPLIRVDIGKSKPGTLHLIYTSLISNDSFSGMFFTHNLLLSIEFLSYKSDSSSFTHIHLHE